jgi:hypothetical protein
VVLGDALVATTAWIPDPVVSARVIAPLVELNTCVLSYTELL